MEKFGVSMAKEPKIMKMDWRSLGFWPIYKDAKIAWEKDSSRKSCS